MDNVGKKKTFWKIALWILIPILIFVLMAVFWDRIQEKMTWWSYSPALRNELSNMAQTSSEADPFPLNRGTIYEYSGDHIPGILFFPVEKAKWNGFKVMAADWKKLTDYQKIMFIKEAAGEIERNEKVAVNTEDMQRVIFAMSEGIKSMEKEAPDVAQVQAMIRFLYDSLKGTEMLTPLPESGAPETI